MRVGPFDVVIHKGLYREIVLFNPDLIILQSIAGNLSYRKVVSWANRNNKKIIMWAPGWEPGRAKGLMLSLKYIFVKSFFRKADFFLSYCTKASGYLEMIGIDRSKIRTCYNGIETDQSLKDEESVMMNAQAIIEKYALYGNVTFLYVGGLIKEKNILMLLRAYCEVKSHHIKTKLFIIGDGPLKEILINKIQKLNDPDIIYLGRIIDKVDPYFAASDCLVMPGIGSLALDQAMFWRKLCIVSVADGTEDDLVVDGKTGFRFRKNDHSGLFSAMIKVITTNQRELETMGRMGREIILQKYNVNVMVDTFNLTIKELLNIF